MEIALLYVNAAKFVLLDNKPAGSNFLHGFIPQFRYYTTTRPLLFRRFLRRIALNCCTGLQVLDSFFSPLPSLVDGTLFVVHRGMSNLK